ATTTDIAAGSTSTASSTTTMSINVDPVAETPTLTALTTVSVNEEAAATRLSTLGGGTLSVSLPLADQDDSITAQVSVAHGTLTVASPPGLTGVSGSRTAVLTFTGLQSSVVSALAAVSSPPNSPLSLHDALPISATTTDIAAGSTSTASSTTTMS